MRTTFSGRTILFQKWRIPSNISKHYKHYEDFIKTLSKLEPPLDKQFIKILDEQLDVIPYEFSEMFTDGFRLGARVMIDIFQGDLGVRENGPSDK